MMKIFIVALLVIGSFVARAHQHQHHGAKSTGDGQYNPYLVADRHGVFFLVYIHRTNNVSNVMLRHSTDGQTFSDPIRVNDRDGDAAVRNENPPKVAVAPNGDVYVCWASERERWKGDIRFSRSIDGGKTFSSAITLNSDAGGAPTGHAFQSITVDRNGRIYVAWIDERNKRKDDRGAEIWLTSSADRGRTFTRDRHILSDVCECCRTSLQVDSEGRVYLAYRTVPRKGPMYRDIIIARSLDGGQTFKPAVVSQDSWELNGCPVAGPSFSIDNTGNLTVIWFMGGGDKPGLYYAVSTNRGDSFSPRERLAAQQRIGKHTHTAVNDNGKVFAVWDDSAESTYSVLGELDGEKKIVRKGSNREGVTYPVLAVNDRVAVIAGMRAEKREVITYCENLNY
jgi:BNR repeat-like domain